MQYKFNRHYLKALLNNSQKQYIKGNISEKDYELIKKIIKEIMYGNPSFSQISKLDSLPVIQNRFTKLKETLGMDMVDKLLYISDAIVRHNCYYNAKKEYHKNTSKDIVTDVLKFYYDYDKQEFNYLNSFVNIGIPKVEIVSNNFINRNRYNECVHTIPFYDLNFVRTIKHNIRYDYATLCHEFRHLLDTKNMNKFIMEYNALSEINAIYMELYYQKIKVKEDKKYNNGIKERMNFLWDTAVQVYWYMRLLKLLDNNKDLTYKMIEEAFEIPNSRELKIALLDLSSDVVYSNITYLIGILKGIDLCTIALNDKESAKEMANKLCSIMSVEEFIPKNIEDILGNEFTIGENNIRTYKEFVKKIK